MKSINNIIRGFFIALFTSFIYIIFAAFGYNASNNSIGINLIVWSIGIVVGYSLFWVIRQFIYIITKKNRSEYFYFEGYSISVSVLIIAIYCCFQVSKTEDSLFLSTALFLLGIIPSIVEFINKKKKKIN